jgi:hypothetical protein
MDSSISLKTTAEEKQQGSKGGAWRSRDGGKWKESGHWTQRNAPMLPTPNVKLVTIHTHVSPPRVLAVQHFDTFTLRREPHRCGNRTARCRAAAADAKQQKGGARTRRP